MILKKSSRIIALLSLIMVVVSACSKESGNSINKDKIYEPNLKKRMAQQAEDTGGIFSSGKKQMGGTFEFASSNVLWRATLKTIDFIPLQSANYSGGLVITDWYSNSLNSKESIKIEVRFYSSELSSNSFEVKSYKKICSGENGCQTIKGDPKFESEIKNRILTEARKISISETKKN